VFFLTAQQRKSADLGEIALQRIERDKRLISSIGLVLLRHDFGKVNIRKWDAEFGGFVFFGHERLQRPDHQRF
jgi:hypothetical protein